MQGCGHTVLKELLNFSAPNQFSTSFLKFTFRLISVYLQLSDGLNYVSGMRVIHPVPNRPQEIQPFPGPSESGQNPVLMAAAYV